MIDPEEFSPSPLQSGGEGREEEAPLGLRETNPSPRCAAQGEGEDLQVFRPDGLIQWQWG